jgi:hypothetical protein
VGGKPISNQDLELDLGQEAGGKTIELMMINDYSFVLGTKLHQITCQNSPNLSQNNSKNIQRIKKMY